MKSEIGDVKDGNKISEQSSLTFHVVAQAFLRIARFSGLLDLLTNLRAGRVDCPRAVQLRQRGGVVALNSISLRARDVRGKQPA